MSEFIRLGILGVGAIARAHHIPSITANPAFTLVAAASRHAQMEGIVNFKDIKEMLCGDTQPEAISICTPPQTHYESAKLCLMAGKHVLLEKPPCTSLAQFSHLKMLAAQANVTLYQTWHSQHAQGVVSAALILRDRKIISARAIWKEDVRRWHSGQAWIWEAGGFGVFDPGINAISILSKLIDEPLLPESATLFVPSNCQTPIAAKVSLSTPSGVSIALDLDFRHTGEQTWDIEIDTDDCSMRLSAGGALLSLSGRDVSAGVVGLRPEYESIYRRFAELISSKCSEADVRPLDLVADIFLIGRRKTVEPYIE